MDTARNKSRRVLDRDLNWYIAKGVLSSDKFLSRQRADWLQDVAGSEEDKKRREGGIGKLDRVQV